MTRFLIVALLFFSAAGAVAQPAWETHTGQPGPSGWRANVIQPDPKNHGPDGINTHDWDDDGDLDIFANYEEGKYSRLFFNPGNQKIRDLWTDYIEFPHGKCEDSGIGDLDNDGDIDYIANGGWVYFNPGKENVRDASTWVRMTLFNSEARVPTVTDINGDGLNDLVVGAHSWFQQPTEGKHDATNWKRHSFGRGASWPMTSLVYDLDKDGDADLIVQDRRKEVYWISNPGKDKVTGPWPRKVIHSGRDFMFMAQGDINNDQTDDLILAGGRSRQNIILLLRTNKLGDPNYEVIVLTQPNIDGKPSKRGGDNFPKGVAVMKLASASTAQQVIVVPKMGDIWYASYNGDSLQADSWKANRLSTPGANTRKKMDNAYLADLDGDGDTDILTSEENGGWGVLWFENPAEPDLQESIQGRIDILVPGGIFPRTVPALRPF